MLLPDRKHRYRTLVCDSNRWDRFVPHDGDIIVATPAKCGTTWMQLICALIVFRGTAFPQPLNVMSPWLDAVFEPEAEVLLRLAMQTHRRIIKTHTPLSALPYYANVQYVVVGRDPRDAFLSFQDHRRNTTADAMAKLFEMAGVAPTDATEDLDTAFQLWVTVGHQRLTKDGFPSGTPLRHLESFWAYRRLQNFHFAHFADLLANREGEMRRIAAFLGEPVSKEIWPGLVGAASLDAMRDTASQLTPAAEFAGKHWRSDANFFKEGRLGAWQFGLSPDNQARYLEITRQTFAPELIAWTEGGRRAFDPTA